MLAILLSGFRSALSTAMVYVALSSYFRKRHRDILIFGMIGVVMLSFLALGNGTFFHLPLPIQRALSFLPGNWDYLAVSDARGSSQWRFEMWKIVLTEDKWIQNKLLGDGFGLTKYDLGIMEGINFGGSGFVGGAVQEGAMIVGAYHSGPLSTIRFVGAMGLVLFYALLIHLAVRGWRAIKRSFNTPYFPVALFIGMPAVFTPFVFTFMVGGFDTNLPEALFSAALIKLLEHALQDAAVPALPVQTLERPIPTRRRSRSFRPQPALS